MALFKKVGKPGGPTKGADTAPQKANFTGLFRSVGSGAATGKKATDKGKAKKAEEVEEGHSTGITDVQKAFNQAKKKGKGKEVKKFKGVKLQEVAEVEGGDEISDAEDEGMNQALKMSLKAFKEADAKNDESEEELEGFEGVGFGEPETQRRKIGKPEEFQEDPEEFQEGLEIVEGPKDIEMGDAGVEESGDGECV